MFTWVYFLPLTNLAWPLYWNKDLISVKGDMYEWKMWQTVRGQEWRRVEATALWSQKRDWFEVNHAWETFCRKMWLRFLSNTGKFRFEWYFRVIRNGILFLNAKNIKSLVDITIHLYHKPKELKYNSKRIGSVHWIYNMMNILPKILPLDKLINQQTDPIMSH